MIDDEFRGPLLFAGVEQVIALAYASLMLDCGMTLFGVIYSSVGYWLGTVIILCRRGTSPTRGDLAYVRVALIPLVIAGVLLAWWKQNFL